MQFQGALIREQGVEFAIVIVKDREKVSGTFSMFLGSSAWAKDAFQAKSADHFIRPQKSIKSGKNVK